MVVTVSLGVVPRTACCASTPEAGGMALGDPCRGDPGTTALASQGDLLTRGLPRSDLQARWILSLEYLCGFRFDSFQMLPHI